jgi:hypothetical protein
MLVRERSSTAQERLDELIGSQRAKQPKGNFPEPDLYRRIRGRNEAGGLGTPP